MKDKTEACLILSALFPILYLGQLGKSKYEKLAHTLAQLKDKQQRIIHDTSKLLSVINQNAVNLQKTNKQLLFLDEQFHNFTQLTNQRIESRRAINFMSI